MSNSLLVGIDVSLNDNKVRILHPDGTSLSKFVVHNSVPGANLQAINLTNARGTWRINILAIRIRSGNLLARLLELPYGREETGQTPSGTKLTPGQGN